MLINNDKFYAGNDYIGNMIHRTPRSVSKMINHLKKAGYIKTEMINNKRYIYINKI